MRGFEANSRIGAALVGLIVLAFASVGCSTFPSSSMFDSKAKQEAAAAEEARIAALPKYTVEIYREGYDAIKKEVPIEDVVFVQDAIEKSGAQRMMGRMKVVLYRKEPGEIQPIRLDIEYDARNKVVSHMKNYSIRPGDRLVLGQDSSGPLDDLVGSIVPGGKLPGVWGGK